MQSDVTVSIIVKTLNEAANIERCIEGILSAVDGVSAEVIVADGGSRDETVTLAARYPVVVVQLKNFSERSCGIGPQLGFQHSVGRFILLLDADMVLHSSFLARALDFLDRNPDYAGVGGRLIECSGTGYEYEAAVWEEYPDDADVSWLDGGGLYRREAILKTGYLSNRNLHAYEEKELGLRLLDAGWKLRRMKEPAVDHFGHTMASHELLRKRWKSGYADACGESIRACFGKPYFLRMLLLHKAMVACLIYQLLLLLTVLMIPFSVTPFTVVMLLGVLGVIVQLIRKGSPRKVFLSFAYTNVFSIGLVRGMLKSQTDPRLPIDSVVLKAAGAVA